MILLDPSPHQCNYRGLKSEEDSTSVTTFITSGALSPAPWGSQGTQCGGDPDQIITWGGPVATFRWDSATDVDIKNFSVREIQPPL